MARPLELLPQLAVVVDDPVEDDRQPERLVDHRLRAALGQVDDREPPVREPARRRRARARRRRARAARARAHAQQRVAVRRRAAPQLTGDAAHQTVRMAGSERAEVKSACSARIRRPSCGAVPRPARERWRTAPVAAASAAHRLELVRAAEVGGVRRARRQQLARPTRAPAAGTRGPGSISCAAMPSRAAMKRFSSSTSGRVDERVAGVALERLQAHEALDERRDRRGVGDARLRVHHADLERAEARLQPHVPPQERRLGERVAAQQHVDALDVVGVGAELARDARRAGRPGRAACASSTARCRGPARTASCPTARAGSAGARACGCRRARPARGSAPRRARAGRTSARAARARASRSRGTGSARRARPRRPPTA